MFKHPAIRALIMPLAFLMFIIGIATSKWLIFGTLGIGLIIFNIIFYSGRKQRVRYWIQGYKTQLEDNGGIKQRP